MMICSSLVLIRTPSSGPLLPVAPHTHDNMPDAPDDHEEPREDNGEEERLAPNFANDLAIDPSYQLRRIIDEAKITDRLVGNGHEIPPEVCNMIMRAKDLMSDINRALNDSVPPNSRLNTQRH